jgi:protein SCO1/2
VTLFRGYPLAVAILVGAAGCQIGLYPAGASGPLFAQRGAWTDDRGEAIALESFRGAPVVVTAFYTSCTVRCPLTIGKLHEVDDAFRASGRVVPIILLTLDPRTDTPDRLRRFKQTRNLPDHWHFIRGSDSDTRGLARYLHVNAAYDDGHIDHDVRIDVFDANGRLLHGFSGWSFDPEIATAP